MKLIRIKYVDFWPDFDVTKDYIYTVLSKNPDYKVELSDDPDYLVYSVFGHEHLFYDCIKIFFAGEEECPNFNIADYAVGFDYITFGDRYFRLPLMYQPLYKSAFDKMLENKDLLNPENRDFCSFVVSNPKGCSIREQFFDELSKYKRVDSGGKYKNNIGGPVVDKLEFESRHKFSISFENVSHPGYLTEKIMQAFGAGCVPIYWGDPSVENVFNEKAFINVMKFPSIEDAIEEVRRVDQDDAAYLEMLHEKPLKQGMEPEIIEKDFSKYIYNIFDQDLECAGRITRMFWNQRYNSLAKNKEILYRISEPLRKIRSRIKKIIGRKD